MTDAAELAIRKDERAKMLARIILTLENEEEGEGAPIFFWEASTLLRQLDPEEVR